MINKIKILPANICSCRSLAIPPVSQNEMENIIRYKLSAFYPGSVDELVIDYRRSGDICIVFYISKIKLDQLKNQYPDSGFYSSYHLFASESNAKYSKQYALIDHRIEIFTKTKTGQFELSSLPFDEGTVSEWERRGYIEISDSIPRNQPRLFPGKKKRNYPLQIAVLLLLLAIIPQLSIVIQYKSDLQYLDKIEKMLNSQVLENTKNQSTEQELELLKLEYEKLMVNKPISLFQFFSELSVLIGKDTVIDSLQLKNNSFQMNARGYKPLNKMEGFQNSDNFYSVIPYQVQSIDDSSKEKFSLTGFYDYE